MRRMKAEVQDAFDKEKANILVDAGSLNECRMRDGSYLVSVPLNFTQDLAGDTMTW